MCIIRVAIHKVGRGMSSDRNSDRKPHTPPNIKHRSMFLRDAGAVLNDLPVASLLTRLYEASAMLLIFIRIAKDKT
jgi:hypothetical protein